LSLNFHKNVHKLRKFLSLSYTRPSRGNLRPGIWEWTLLHADEQRIVHKGSLKSLKSSVTDFCY